MHRIKLIKPQSPRRFEVEGDFDLVQSGNTGITYGRHVDQAERSAGVRGPVRHFDFENGSCAIIHREERCIYSDSRHLAQRRIVEVHRKRGEIVAAAI